MQPKRYAVRILPSSSLPTIDPAGVTEGYVLHDSGEQNVGHLHRKVHVIVHPAIGLYSVTKPLHAFSHQGGEMLAVPLLVKTREIVYTFVKEFGLFFVPLFKCLNGCAMV